MNLVLGLVDCGNSRGDGSCGVICGGVGEPVWAKDRSMRATILIGGPELQGASEARLLAEVRAAWPCGRRGGHKSELEFERCTFAKLLVKTSDPDPIRLPLDEVAILIATKKCDVADVDRSLEGLQDMGLPVVLVAEDDARWRAYEHRGVMVFSMEISGMVLAPMLYALSSRQQFVAGLMHEVAIMQRCQAGIRAEVERMHEELHLAAGVQHEFTASPLPTLEGIKVNVLYRPVNAVSGDIYNVRQVDEETVAFFVADAVGHGVPAALLTMILTNSLITADTVRLDGRGVSVRLSPSEVLGRLNQRLVDGSMHTGRFATGLYGLINTRTGLVTVAGAGHPAPVVLGRGGIRELETTGPLLGVFPDAEFDCATTTLQQGETLLLYTDGLEAGFPRIRSHGLGDAGSGSLALGEGVVKSPTPGPSQREGDMKRVSRHVEQLRMVFHDERRDMDAGDCMRQLEALLDEQSGSLHQADDITVIAMSVDGKAVEKKMAA